MKKDYKIAIFLPSFLGGGVERMMVYLANNFAEKGYNVDLVVIKNYGPYKTLVSTKVDLIDLKKKRVLTSIFTLSKYLKENKPDVLLSAMNYVNIVAYLANVISNTNTKLVISERNVPSLSLKNKSSFVILKKFMTRLYPKVHKIIAISIDVKDDLINNFQIPNNKITVINNMVDLSNIKELSAETKKMVYDRYFDDYQYNSQIVLGVGRLVDVKNFEYLIEAFALVNAETPFVKLLILGEGELRKELERLIKNYNLEHKIKLPGFVDNPHEVMQISSLFVSSSKYEGFGNVIIEAMSVGLPIIVTDCIGGPKEIINYGEYGEIVPLNNVKVFAEKIKKVLTREVHPDVIKRSKDFSIEVIADKYLKVLLD